MGPAAKDSTFSKEISTNCFFGDQLRLCATRCPLLKQRKPRVAASVLRGDFASNRRPLIAARSSTPTTDEQTMFSSKLLPKCLLS